MSRLSCGIIIAAMSFVSQPLLAKHFKGKVNFVFSEPNGDAVIVLNTKNNCGGYGGRVLADQINFSEMFALGTTAFISGKNMTLFITEKCHGDQSIVTHGAISNT